MLKAWWCVAWCLMLTKCVGVFFLRKGKNPNKVLCKGTPKRAISANMFSMGRSWEIICATLQRVTDGWEGDGIAKCLHWVRILFKKCINSHFSCKSRCLCNTLQFKENSECHKRLFPWVMNLVMYNKIKMGSFPVAWHKAEFVCYRLY